MTKVLYGISTALFIPVVLALLFYFVRALFLLGAFYHTWVSRMKFRGRFVPFLRSLEKAPDTSFPSQITKQSALGYYAKKLYTAANQPPIADKIIADFELYCQKDLSRVRTLAKIGPILGLMGTLIPMGPALVALAQGDVTNLANNMQVAFATTVVGLFIGGIGFLITQIKQNWYNEELNDLHYARTLITAQYDEKKSI